MVVGPDNSISFKTLDPTPGPDPMMIVQQWPPPVTDWQVEDDGSWSDDTWQKEQNDDNWSYDLSKSNEPTSSSILDRWHKQQQQQGSILKNIFYCHSWVHEIT